jgi:predicted ArsR family transcriptional regulator
MRKRKWTFLSNHGRVLAYITKHPQKTTQLMAYSVGLSIHGVQIILDELEEQGYIERHKVGRCNQYLIHPDMPMRHRFDRQHTVGDVLEAIGAMPHKDIHEL